MLHIRTLRCLVATVGLLAAGALGGSAQAQDAFLDLTFDGSTTVIELPRKPSETHPDFPNDRPGFSYNIRLTNATDQNLGSVNMSYSAYPLNSSALIYEGWNVGDEASGAFPPGQFWNGGTPIVPLLWFVNLDDPDQTYEETVGILGRNESGTFLGIQWVTFRVVPDPFAITQESSFRLDFGDKIAQSVSLGPTTPTVTGITDSPDPFRYLYTTPTPSDLLLRAIPPPLTTSGEPQPSLGNYVSQVDFRFQYLDDGKRRGEFLRIVSDPPIQIVEGDVNAAVIVQPPVTSIEDIESRDNEIMASAFVIPTPSRPGPTSATLEYRTNSTQSQVSNNPVVRLDLDYFVDPFFQFSEGAGKYGRIFGLSAATDTGVSNSDVVTNVTTPRVELRAEFLTLGTEVELLLGGQSMGVRERSSEAELQLAWDVPTTAALSDGTYTFLFRATEPFDFTTREFELGGASRLIIDTVAPVATFAPLAVPVVNAFPEPLAVTYDETVYRLEASDFQLLADGTPVDTSALSLDGSDNLVGLAALLEDGRTYELRVAPGSDAIDEAGNGLTAAPLSFTYDVSNPTVAFNDLSPAVVEQAPDPFPLATFSESVENVDIGDLTLTRNGAPVALNGATFDASGTLSGIGGLVAETGVYEIAFAASTDIQDAAGNPLAPPTEPLTFRVVDDGLAESGDLNGDGTPDAAQAQVASGTDSGGDPFYVEIVGVAPAGSTPWLEGVTLINANDASLPADTSLPEGAFAFTVNGLDTAEPSSVTLRLRVENESAAPYRNILKIGDGAPRVFDGPFTAIDANTYEIVLLDNGPDDLNPALGVIEDPSGPSSTGPLPPYLAAFQGVVEPAGTVTLEWTTTSEPALAAFDIVEALEDPVSDWTAGATLTPAPIAATGGPATGAGYTFDDSNVLNFGESRSYYLVEEETGGQRNTYGPITVTNNNTAVGDWTTLD